MGSKKLKDVDRFELNYMQSQLLVFQQEAVIRRLKSKLFRIAAHDDSEALEDEAEKFEELFKKQKAHLANRMKEIGKAYGVDFSRSTYDPNTGEIRD